jgi:formylglycine-generating enzyme required for sulfatase activity
MRARRSGPWTALLLTGGLVGACNAIFGIEDPEHDKDTGGTGGDGANKGGQGGTSTAGSVSDGGTAGDATTGGKGNTGGKGGTAGNTATGGNGGTAGTTAGDAGAGGESGAPSGGTTSTGGSSTGGSNTGGKGGAGTCPTNPADCEPSMPPSCAGLSKQACSGDSCCESPTVPGCTGCNFPEGHTSSITPFRLDAFEVTVARFRKYVDAYTGPPAAGQGTQPNVPGTGWSTDWDTYMTSNKQQLTDHVLRCGTSSTFTADVGPNDLKPMNCMSWFEAFGFCVWDNGFLPTEMQRTFAAANGDDNRYYPWGGTALDHNHALWGYCGTGFSTSCAVSDITFVGQFPLGDSVFGQHDMTGSMWEWVFDYDGGAWPPQEPCNNCVNTTPPGGSYRLIRGGGWSQSSVEQPVTYRNANDEPSSVWKNVGIRCARAM